MEEDAALRAIVQLVQIPLHASLIVLIVLIAWRAVDRLPWYWLLAGAAFVALRRLLMLYWLGEEGGLLRFLGLGILPCASSACYLVWAALLWRAQTQQPQRDVG